MVQKVEPKGKMIIPKKRLTTWFSRVYDGLAIRFHVSKCSFLLGLNKNNLRKNAGYLVNGK
jgi:hypothetical protein